MLLYIGIYVYVMSVAPSAERGFWLSLSGASGAIFVTYNVDSHLAVGFRSWDRFTCPGLGYWSPLSDG